MAERPALMVTRTLTAGLAWGLLWAVGYNPADYPARLAVRALGRPAAAVNQGMRREGRGLASIEFRLKDGSVVRQTTHTAAFESPGGVRLLTLDLGGMKVHRPSKGFPFGLFDYVLTLALAFLALRLWVPGFFGPPPVFPRPGAPRLPWTALKAADIAAAVCAILGPFLYSPAQACLTAVVWLAVRSARLLGFVEFIQLAPPAAAHPLLAIPPSVDAPVRRVPEPRKDPDSFLAVSTREGWSRIPAGALAAGFLILALVKARNQLVSVPEPGYHLFGLGLETWSLVGWALVTSGLAVALREFLLAWRRSED